MYAINLFVYNLQIFSVKQSFFRDHWVPFTTALRLDSNGKRQTGAIEYL